MNNTLHTPAPWNLNGNGILLHPVTNAQLVTQRIETSLGSFEVLDETNEPEANAYLIAAAPDLLQVVADYVLLCDLHDYVGAVPDAAREALRKAKGEA